MAEKKDKTSVKVDRRNGVVNDSKSVRTQKSFTTSHNKEKIGKPKPGGG